MCNFYSTYFIDKGLKLPKKLIQDDNYIIKNFESFSTFLRNENKIYLFWILKLNSNRVLLLSLFMTRITLEKFRRSCCKTLKVFIKKIIKIFWTWDQFWILGELELAISILFGSARQGLIFKHGKKISSKKTFLQN